MTDPPAGGTPTTEVLDVHGNTLQKIQHLGTTTAATSTRTTSYSYDAAGDMLTLADPGGNLWKWTYDLRGNQVTAKDPDQGTTTTTYDNDDQPVTTTDNRGVSITTSYDELGRRVGLYDGKQVDASKQRAAWVYDTVGIGQLTSATRFQTPGDASTAFVQEVTGYEIHDQPTGTRTAIPSIQGLTDSLAGTYTTSMYYNDAGTLYAKSLPAAWGLPSETTQTSHDLYEQPIGMGGRDSIVSDTTYSPYGELQQVVSGTTSGKNAYQTWLYDEGTRRLSRNVVSDDALPGYLADITYGYDAAGNVLRAADAGQVKDLQCFGYDALRQLTQAWTIGSGSCAKPSQSVMGTAVGAYWSSYSYDVVGNRKSEVDHVKTGSANTTTSYSYPASGSSAVPGVVGAATGAGGPHAVSSTSSKKGAGAATSMSYAYDAVGNMTTRGAQTLTWDAEGELATIKTAAGTGRNVYDADGNRILRQAPDGVTTLYLDSTEIRLSGGVRTSQRWYSFGGRVVMTRTPELAPTGAPTTLSMLAPDGQGTSLVQIDADNASFSKRRFDPFGGARKGSGSATWSGDHGFLDKPRDSSGLTQVGARSYDAGLGRFVSVDPLLVADDPQQLNGYQYAGNNPVTNSDPTGLMYPVGNGGPDDPHPSTTNQVQHGTWHYSKPPVTSPPSSPPPAASHGWSVWSLGKAAVEWRSEVAWDDFQSVLHPVRTAQEMGQGVVDDATGCSDLEVGSCAWFAVDVVPAGGLAASGAKRGVKSVLKRLAAREMAEKSAANAGASVVRPTVSDVRLGRALADDFRGGPNPIGDGSALDAARHTLASGDLVGGSTHLEKAVEMRDRYARVLRRGGLNQADQGVAQGRYDAYSSFVQENDLDAMMRARGLR